METFDYPGIRIELSSPDSQELITLDKEVRECESIRNQLLSELSKIDRSIQEYKDELYETAKNSFDFAEESLNNVNERRLDSGRLNARDKANLIAAGASAAFGIATGAFGFVSGKIKEHKAQKAFDKKMDELLEKKAIIADEKLPHVTEIYQKMQSGVFARIESLYSSVFNMSVTDVCDKTDKQILMFRKSVGMVLKTRELSDSFKYIIKEMQAWQNGQHDSKFSRRDLVTLFYQEINSWPETFGSKDWLELSRRTYNSTEKSISLPLAFTLSDPVMLSRYVRIGLPEEDSLSIPEDEGRETDFLLKGVFTSQVEEKGKIHKKGKIKVKDTLAGNIIKNNSYYKHCEEIAENSFKYPTEPAIAKIKFGVSDVLFILLALAILVGYVCLVCAIFKGNFFRTIFILLPYLIGVLIELSIYDGILDFFSDIDGLSDIFYPFISPVQEFFDWFVDLLPYSRRKDKEYRKLCDYKNRINACDWSILTQKRQLFESNTIKL